MVDTSDLSGLRFSAGVLVPGTAAFLETLTRGSRLLCEYAQDATHDRNRELCAYLDGFVFRVESERHEGRLASQEWMLQFQSLFDRISAHVIESERRSRLAALWNAGEESAQVERFREEINNLQLSIEFNYP